MHQESGFAVFNDDLLSLKKSCHRGLSKGLQETQRQKITKLKLSPTKIKMTLFLSGAWFLDSFTIVNSKITSLLVFNKLKAARQGLQFGMSQEFVEDFVRRADEISRAADL